MKPRLAITIGDVNGIGPEIIVKVFEDPELIGLCRPVIVGSIRALEKYAQYGDLTGRIARVSEPDLDSLPQDAVGILEPPDLPAPAIVPGSISADAGTFAFHCVELATRLALNGRVDAIVTCPVSKTAVNMAGYGYAGHTEFLAELCGCADYRMMLVAGALRVVHLTTHIPLKEALKQVTSARVADTIRLAHEAVEQLGIERPRIAVAGLNPHAGEGTLFGMEERDEIVPAIETVRADGIDVTGPVPPDTVFMQMARGKFDAVVAMYHDQGHIPLKMAAFNRTVNVTLGLPIIRTSVGHGTAFDIAGKGQADPTSLAEAVRVAATMARRSEQAPR
jgi:4-hydroxythreonine-4-phosphate dehydrogenase